MNRFPVSPGILRAVLLSLTAAAGLSAAQPRVVAGERLKMRDNSAEVDVKDRMEAAAQAVSEENLDAFLGCFAARERSRLRRPMALLFVKHALDLELLDSHVVTQADEKAELAVHYRVALSGDSHAIVSIIGLVKEEDDWRIAGERIESRADQGRGGPAASGGGQVFRFGGGGDAMLNPPNDDFLPKDIGRRPGGGCANGRCGL